MNPIKIIDLRSSLMKSGIKATYKNKSDNESFNTELYEELKSLYNEYKTQLYNKDKELLAQTAMAIDMKQYNALCLANKKTPDTISYLNAIRRFYLEKMQENDYDILDSIILSKEKYIYTIFKDQESFNIITNYLKNCKKTVQELEEKYNQNTITNQEKDILMRLFSNYGFSKKYPELKTKLLKDMSQKEEISKIEADFLSREVAHWKSERRKVPYIKPYLIQKDEKNKIPTYGGAYLDNLLFVNYEVNKSSVQDFIWVVLHEYEHHIQEVECSNGILTKNSLAQTLCKILNKLSHDNYQEYKKNYNFKDIEVYANAKAQVEMIIFKLQKFGYRGFDKIPSKLNYENNYARSIVAGHQKNDKSEIFTIGEYNMLYLEAILQKNESILDKNPLLLTLYNQRQRRLKNIFELSEEYVKHPIEGKEVLSTVVDHQILKGDLNNIRFNTMSKEKITKVLLLLSRNLKNTLIRLYDYIADYRIEAPLYQEDAIRTKNLTEIIKILKNEISFFRKNLNTIKELVDDWTNYVDDENIRIELFEKEDSPIKFFQQSAEFGLGIGYNNPIYYIERMAQANIVEMMENNNQKYKHMSQNEKENVADVLKTLKEELETIDEIGTIKK